jgi:tetratricopeptide (TPR) repeat protein
MSDIDNQREQWSGRAARQTQLDAIEQQLRVMPDAIDAQIDRANLLHLVDRQIEARDAFLRIVQRFPTNFRALNEFGNLLVSMGYIMAAGHVYAEATKHHPANPTGHVNLANLLLQSGNFDEACKHYELALRINPSHREAHRGLGATLSAMGDRERANPHLKTAFGDQCLATIPYRGDDKPIPILKLVSSGDGNIQTNSFLDDRIYMTTVAVADFLDHSVPLPHHDVIFNAIGDADICQAALDAATAVVARSGAPVINDPSAVAKTGRSTNAKRLAHLAGVRTPLMVDVPRALLASTEGYSVLQSRGVGYPFLLRAPGFHTGRNFVLVNNAIELQSAASSLPGSQLLVIEYLDARGSDGHARKYRVIIVDGHIYPLHVAISRQWKVHYFTADMAENPAHRSEDAAFLADINAVLGSQAMRGLRHIRDILSLDYGGIDFGLGANGEVLLFEANATMVVNPPSGDARWDYRRSAVSKILDAVSAMILRKAAGRSWQKIG